MKKIVAILLILCLCPLCAWAETALAAYDPAYAELIHAIFEANQPEALFSRHESVQFLFVNPAAPDGYDVIWETKDAYCQSFSDYYAVLMRDQITYALWDYGPESLILTVRCNYNEDTPFYTVAGSKEEALVDPAHERPTDSYEKDGKTYLITEYDEYLSRQSLESMSLEYTGQTVMSRLIADTETYEILGVQKFVVENGEENVYEAILVSFDRGEPVACHALRAAFERTNAAKMNVTFVFDPGTDHETVKTVTAAASTDCWFDCGSVPCVYFYDLEQTRCTGWDSASDWTVYIYTNPSEELTRHFQEVYTAATQE